MASHLVFLEEAVHGLRDVSGVDRIVVGVGAVVTFFDERYGNEPK